VLAARTPEYAALDSAGFEVARRREPPTRREVAMVKDVQTVMSTVSRAEMEGMDRCEGDVLGQQAKKKLRWGSSCSSAQFGERPLTRVRSLARELRTDRCRF
jgi:hypothetical protein